MREGGCSKEVKHKTRDKILKCIASSMTKTKHLKRYDTCCEITAFCAQGIFSRNTTSNGFEYSVELAPCAELNINIGVVDFHNFKLFRF